MKSKTFHTLWTQYARRGDRDDKLLFCARLLGKPVDTTKDLTDQEFDRLIAEIRRLSRTGLPACLPDGSGRVVSMTGSPSSPDATREQIWKVHQLETWLGWRSQPERLSGFLRQHYRVDRADQLSPRDAWRAIEALFGVAASPFKAAEKRVEIRRLKGVLRTWRPSDAA